MAAAWEPVGLGASQQQADHRHPYHGPMWRHLLTLSLAEWRHHPWRHGVALLAVALGVALASSVQMINESALAEFSQAVRSVNGEPDAVLASNGSDGLSDDLYALLALDESVALASPVLEIDSLGRRDRGEPVGTGGTTGTTGAGGKLGTVGTGGSGETDGVGGSGGSGGSGQPAGAAAADAAKVSPRVALRILGVDGLKVARIAPGLLPRPAATAAAGRSSFFDPDVAYLNPAAMAALSLQPGNTIALQDLNHPPLLVVTPSAPDDQLRPGVHLCSVATLPTQLKRFGIYG